MVTFGKDEPWSLFDMVDLEDELAVLVGRQVEVVTRPSVERNENYIVRKNILRSSYVYYAG
jgi:predicted nucleotidyltransferase